MIVPATRTRKPTQPMFLMLTNSKQRYKSAPSTKLQATTPGKNSKQQFQTTTPRHQSPNNFQTTPPNNSFGQPQMALSEKSRQATARPPSLINICRRAAIVKTLISPAPSWITCPTSSPGHTFCSLMSWRHRLASPMADRDNTHLHHRSVDTLCKMFREQDQAQGRLDPPSGT